METAQALKERRLQHIGSQVVAGAEAENEIARAIGLVGDKGDACGLIRQSSYAIRDHSVGAQLIEQTVAEGIGAD